MKQLFLFVIMSLFISTSAYAQTFERLTYTPGMRPVVIKPTIGSFASDEFVVTAPIGTELTVSYGISEQPFLTVAYGGEVISTTFDDFAKTFTVVVRYTEILDQSFSTDRLYLNFALPSVTQQPGQYSNVAAAQKAALNGSSISSDSDYMEMYFSSPSAEPKGKLSFAISGVPGKSVAFKAFLPTTMLSYFSSLAGESVSAADMMAESYSSSVSNYQIGLTEVSGGLQVSLEVPADATPLPDANYTMSWLSIKPQPPTALTLSSGKIKKGKSVQIAVSVRNCVAGESIQILKKIAGQKKFSKLASMNLSSLCSDTIAKRFFQTTQLKFVRSGKTYTAKVVVKP